jgi:C1A family cysteine protease
MSLAFEYAEDFAIETEADYPYKGRDGICQFVSAKGNVKATSYKNVQARSSDQLKAAINLGPTSVSIEADRNVFQGYTGGVLNSSLCGTNLDHGVLAVGYGTEGGQEYYLVKNSWGPDWGLNGFIKIAVTPGAGVCGIQLDSSYPNTN